MTSQYVTEPPTSGLVELITSKGPITIELFARETPQACRNFLTLALEGFYDNLVFHRLIPGFMIQSGDPSGTGAGGESMYGEPFPIEPHSRLKFNRRGLLAMAAGEDRTNESQFFLTLDATPELQGKHTLMGRVVGKTIYNLMELAQGVEMEKDSDRPRYPPKLKEVRVVENPFDDLKPRMTREQRRDEERRRKEEKERTRVEEEKRKRGKVKKNTGLLSFGAEEEEGEMAGMVLKGPKSSHDLLKDDRRLAKQPMETSKKSSKTKHSKVQEADAAPDAVASSSSSAIPLATTPATNGTSEADKPKGKARSDRDTKSSSRTNNRAHASSSAGRDFLSAERAKYLSSKSSSSKEDKSYSALLSFQSRLRTSDKSSSSFATKASTVEDEEDEEEAREYGASDDDDDWRNHRLDAGGAPLVSGRADKVDDYEVLDPREHGRKDTREARKDGKRGRDWHKH
uniref:Cyclophilin n=1 Tax=Kalmanozyma brasiliensis (strain GHG001) TaxID=1365824 RepID=V5ERR3_KALBG